MPFLELPQPKFGFFQKNGHKIIAISDSKGGIVNENGLDAGKIESYKKERVAHLKEKLTKLEKISDLNIEEKSDVEKIIEKIMDSMPLNGRPWP